MLLGRGLRAAVLVCVPVHALVAKCRVVAIEFVAALLAIVIL